MPIYHSWWNISESNQMKLWRFHENNQMVRWLTFFYEFKIKIQIDQMIEQTNALHYEDNFSILLSVSLLALLLIAK